jgi:GMP synthase (glutamine-hydrolysing)
MQKILIVDFGSQYTQLIARRIRSFNVFCEIVSCKTDLTPHLTKDTRGVILSGGPASVNDPGAPQLDMRLLEIGVPVLGICYGFQLLAKSLGGEVSKSDSREYGLSYLIPDEEYYLKSDADSQVWMSHGDKVTKLPNGWVRIASTSTCEFAVAEDISGLICGIQFHPEVTHTPDGSRILKEFVRSCRISSEWTSQSFIDKAVEDIKITVGSDNVICALSGGVDSAVTAALIYKAIGSQLTCVFVDNGLMRHNERHDIEGTFSSMFGGSFHCTDAGLEFLHALQGVSDPEQKRKIIGHKFIEVFDRFVAESSIEYKFLAQGTLYPDVIESTSANGPSAVIKSHHNVGGLPEGIKFSLLEPLRYLFKDEVREVGRSLGIDSKIIDRQPFPGPGLAIRISGAVDELKLSILRRADLIVREEAAKRGLDKTTWQCFAALLPIRTVGVMGDGRTYDYMACLRVVNSEDGMTASVPWPIEFLEQTSSRIVNEVKGINRVVYDITTKPPSTIELE